MTAPEMRCAICGLPIEEFPDAFSHGWTHVDLDVELSCGHTAVAP